MRYYWWRSRHTEQWNREPRKRHKAMPIDIGAKPIQQRKNTFATNGAGTTGQVVGKNNLNLNHLFVCHLF
jgi:hypothetical protein